MFEVHHVKTGARQLPTKRSIVVVVAARGCYSLTLSRAGPQRGSAPISTSQLPHLRGRPERIFVSVDESTGRSTLSFAPAEIGAPIQLENDPAGNEGIAKARAIAAAYPGALVLGPHFHAAGKPRTRRGRR